MLTRWYKAPELPPEVFSVWRKANGALSPVAIVATVDADGTPRSAPFGSLRAMSPRVLRFSPTHFQTTYTNLCRDGRVLVTMVAAPNIAVSVRGGAHVMRERMGANENRAIAEIDIAEVKNNMVPMLVIENGITISAREEYRDRFQSLSAEVEGI
jgi:flavin reductase (DIM6/NTAB) family NADH-FMN oxidoreductase RutF